MPVRQTNDHPSFGGERQSHIGDEFVSRNSGPSSHCFTILGSLGLFLNLCLLGCGSVSSGDDDHHIQHHVPEHKPSTFSAAVEQIDLRHKRLAAGFRTGESDLVRQELSELNDIVGWLAELAADSPMKKPEWDRVNATSKELQVVYQNIVSATNNHSRGEWPTDANRVDQLIETLTTLIPFTSDKP